MNRAATPRRTRGRVALLRFRKASFVVVKRVGNHGDASGESVLPQPQQAVRSITSHAGEHDTQHAPADAGIDHVRRHVMPAIQQMDPDWDYTSIEEVLRVVA